MKNVFFCFEEEAYTSFQIHFVADDVGRQYLLNSSYVVNQMRPLQVRSNCAREYDGGN